MRLFICLLDPENRGISDTARRAYERVPRARGLHFQWQAFGQAALLTAWDNPDGDPLVAHDGGHVAVGMVRLDNRPELERWLAYDARSLSDLELVLRTVAQYGASYIPKIVGDFAFVVWNTATRTAVVACDALMVKHLYYAERSGLFVFASRAEALAIDDQYEVQHLAELVASCKRSPQLTVYVGVHPVPEGTFGVLERGRLTLRQYWSPWNFKTDPRWAKAERDAAATCRELLIDSVRLRLGSNGDTWAQLSGGLDSSSVASIARWLLESGRVPHGVAGTVTYVDRQGTGADEREYSDAVVSRWGLRNEMIIDSPVWHNGDDEPPRLDRPSVGFLFYPREQRLCTIVRAAGGRVLLTGVGGDELFKGTMLFFADWLARGRIGPALREVARRAAIGRVSFWELGYRNALLPLLPRSMRLKLAGYETKVAPWIQQAAVRLYGLDARSVVSSTYDGPIGQKYYHAIVTNFVGIGRNMGYQIVEQSLDLRHPFLYRPLVEFALTLPSELSTRPHARKWVLREAMRDLLPESVRTRVGKGDPVERYAWSLASQRSLLGPLVHEPILADLGVVDAAQLRAAFDEAPLVSRRKDDLHGALQGVLSIEAWLQMRVGRWPQDIAAVARH